MKHDALKDVMLRGHSSSLSLSCGADGMQQLGTFQPQSCPKSDFAILPRRKSRDNNNTLPKVPVLVTKEILEQYFGMSLRSASKELVWSPCLFRKAALILYCYAVIRTHASGTPS